MTIDIPLRGERAFANELDDPLATPGSRFQVAREALHMSQDELGRWLGVHRHTIQRWEQTEPTRIAGLAIAYLLSVDPNLKPTLAKKYAQTL